MILIKLLSFTTLAITLNITSYKVVYINSENKQVYTLNSFQLFIFTNHIYVTLWSQIPHTFKHTFSYTLNKQIFKYEQTLSRIIHIIFVFHFLVGSQGKFTTGGKSPSGDLHVRVYSSSS